MQESLHSFSESVPSRPHGGLVREPLCQKDICGRLQHTTSHQKQSRVSELNRIWDDKKSLLVNTAISLKSKQKIVLRFAARTRTELVLLNDGRVRDVASEIGGTLVLPLLNVDDVKHHLGEIKGFTGISNLVEIIRHEAYRWLRHVCMYVWSSNIARVWINRVRLPILHVVS